MRRFAALIPAAAALAALAPGSAPVRASTPVSSSLSYAHPSDTWTGSGMVGSAAEERRTACPAQPTACDFHTLHIDTTVNGVEDPRALVRLELTPDDLSQMEITLYPPGCNATDPQAPHCYSVPGDTAVLGGPQNGDWTIGVTCDACAGGSYTLKATLTQFQPHVPVAADQSFGWHPIRLPRDRDDPTSTSYGEPGISINRNGKVVINTFGPTVWVSTDDGKTFSGPTNIDPTPCSGLSGDADAQVSFDDYYYVDNLCLAGGTNVFLTSHDDGGTWNLSFAGTDVDRQWIAPDPKNAGVVYMEYHDLEGPNIWVLKSTDHGQTFTQLTPITLELSQHYVDTSQGNTTSRMVIDPTDPSTLTVMYANNTAQDSATTPPNNPDFNLNRVFMAQSHDGGATWTNTDVYDAGQSGGKDNTIAHEFPQTTIDSAGNIYFLFSERLGDKSETHIMMGVIPHGTTTMKGPYQVDSSGLGANVFPWAAAGDPGMVDITWYGSLSNDNNDATSQWSEMFAQTVDALSGAPHFTQSRMSGIVPMHYNNICLAGTLCAVTMGDRNLADFQGVDVDKCGFAEAVWTDDFSGDNFTMFARQTGGQSIRPSAGCSGTQAASVSSPIPAPSASASPTPSGVAHPGSLPNTSAAADDLLPPIGLVGLATLGAWRSARRRRVRRIAQ